MHTPQIQSHETRGRRPDLAWRVALGLIRCICVQMALLFAVMQHQGYITPLLAGLSIFALVAVATYPMGVQQ